VRIDTVFENLTRAGSPTNLRGSFSAMPRTGIRNKPRKATPARRKTPARVRPPRRQEGTRHVLRRSREALVELTGELDSLLTTLRTPGARIDKAAPDRLRAATRKAGEALSALRAP